MPLESWFPTVIFFEDLQADPAVTRGAIAAVEERVDLKAIEKNGYVTANNARNDLHLDRRIDALFDVMRPRIVHFLFELMQFDPAQIEFYVGRCWPVVQIGNGYAGVLHHHGAAAFSGVFYLQTPDGSGGLEFHKPTRAAYDTFPKTSSSGLTYVTANYQAVENRLVMFSGELMHRRLANSGGTADQRVAIAFDLFAMADIGAYTAGMPRAEYLKRVL